MMRTFSILMLCLFAVSPLWSRDFKETRKVIDSILEEAPDRKPDQSGKGGTRDLSGKEGERDGRGAKNRKESGPAVNPEERTLFNSAQELYNTGFFDGAMQKATELKNRFPQGNLADQARILTARIHNKQYRHDEAIRELNGIKDNSGEYRQALLLLGESHHLKGNAAGALDYYQRLYSQFPTDPLTHGALLAAARILHSQHRGQQALDAVVRLIKEYGQKDTVDDAYYLMGKIFETDPVLRDIETARRVYRLFIKKADSNDERFSRSPLRERVRKDLQRLEKNHFRLEN